MVVSCCVPLCRNRFNSANGLSWHSIPMNNTKITQLWICAIRRDPGKNFRVTKATKVCSSHFLRSDFKPLLHTKQKILKPGVIPSVFPWTKADTVCSVHFQDGRPTKENPNPSCRIGKGKRGRPKERRCRKIMAPPRNLESLMSDHCYASPAVESIQVNPKTPLKSLLKENRGKRKRVLLKNSKTKTGVEVLSPSRPAVSSTSVSTGRRRVHRAFITTTVPEDDSSEKQSEGKKEIAMPDPNALLRMLKLPPNVMFNVNARKTTVVKQKRVKRGTVSAVKVKAEPPAAEPPQPEGEVIIPEQLPNVDWIKKEPEEYPEMESVPEEVVTADFVDSLQPNVEMSFECEEEPLLNIKTEPPDENDGPGEFMLTPDMIKREPAEAIQEEGDGGAPTQMTFANKQAMAKDHSYRRRTKRRKR